MTRGFAPLWATTRIERRSKTPLERSLEINKPSEGSGNVVIVFAPKVGGDNEKPNASRPSPIRFGLRVDTVKWPVLQGRKNFQGDLSCWELMLFISCRFV